MKTLLDSMGPMLEGRLSVQDAAARLGVAKHLEIYQRFCAAHRNTALAHVFAYCKDALGTRWPETVEAYFRAFPMHHVEINANGADFPLFLKQQVLQTPDWLCELADFEWWEWQTRTSAGQAQNGLGATVELRPYNYDFVDWDRSNPPKRRETLVVFWRDRTDEPRRERVTPEELDVLRAVFEGRPPAASAVRDDLLAAGILV